VRFVGEPIAAVAAIDRATAEDALDSIRVTYEPLPAVVDPEAAITPDAPVLYDELGSNVLCHDTLVYGDVDSAFAEADGVLRERFEMQRYASTPLETFGCIAEYELGTDEYGFWTNDQRPGLTMGVLAESLRVPQARIRLRCPDIGGGFGNKRRPAYLLVCALLARASGRPVKYVEDRIENLTALMHACGGSIDLELAYRADGTLLALRVVVHDCGPELNPGIVEGMVHGATAHGIGAALLEEFRYDEQGQLLTASFMDDLKPTSLDVPNIVVDRLEHPSPFTPLGAKGVGEGGAIPGPACVANAVEDALAHLGCTIRSLPITPDRVWRWLQGN